MLYQICHGAVSFADEEILHDINFEIRNTEKIAVVGRNGCGKTTLLKLIHGDVELDKRDSDEDIFIAKAGNPQIGYLKQIAFEDPSVTLEQEVRKVFAPMERRKKELEAAAQALETDYSEEAVTRYTAMEEKFKEDGGYYFEKEYDVIIRKFGFSEEERKKPLSEFSGGQQTKIAFIKLLLSKPDILLLDEPTNHLDITTIEWLEGYLKNYPKAVVIVSHDRMFLDRVIDVTYEIEYHRIRRYPGNYTAFLRQKEEALAKQEKDYEAQQAEIKRLTDWIEKWKNTPTKVAATRSKRKVIEHMVLIEKPRKFDTKAFQGQFLPQTASYHDVLSVRGLQIGYDSVLSKVSFELHRMERIAVIGENGKGKSTLLKTLVGELPKLGGQFSFGTGVEWGYFDQQAAVAESQNPKMTIMEDFWEEYPTLKEVEVRSALGSFLFSGDDVYKELGQLSGGEKVRLALCKMFKRRPNLLILDEPTNHMDIVGKEALEQMLKSYTGTVLFVSHDRYFIKEIATGILDFQADKVQYYPCTYEEYLEQKQKEAQGLIGGNKTNAAGNSGKSRNVAGEAADNRNISQVGSQSNPPTLSDVFDKKTYYNPGKIISRLKQQLVKYEKMLGESEERLAELQMQQMDTALATDYEKLTELEQAIAAEQSNQESILDRLVETETELDEMQEKTV